MPTPMFLVFVATILAGSLGALHYLVVHIILGRPFGDEGDMKSPPGTPPGAPPAAPGVGRRPDGEYHG